MNSQIQKNSFRVFGLIQNQIWILAKFFLIIFVYHILKDLKDALVITASDAGSEVIPFIKIWGVLPSAILASFCFSCLYRRFGREKTLYIMLGSLLGFYITFAFLLFPYREILHLNSLAYQLELILPQGMRGFISMIQYWSYTFFYLSAELWSLMILSVLFWGFVNETTSMDQAKKFYPICAMTGNIAGIIAGQSARFLSSTIANSLNWQIAMQMMIALVVLCGIIIMTINRKLSIKEQSKANAIERDKRQSLSFKESVQSIFNSTPLFCIAILVVGFALTTNLIEVVWKKCIKDVYSEAHQYNAYVNQLTSCIGFLSVFIALLSRWLFKRVSWKSVAMITPILLFITSSIFFTSMHLSSENIGSIATFFSTYPAYLIMSLGSLYYLIAMTAKYTLFDMCKEMAFLSIDKEKRIRAKSVIDCIGSRLGKSGASSFYQILLVVFGGATAHVPLIGIICIFVIGMSIVSANKLGKNIAHKQHGQLQKQSSLLKQSSAA